MENYLINLALGFSVCILIVQSHQELDKEGVNYMEQQVDRNFAKNADLTKAPHSKVLSEEEPLKIHSTETPLKTVEREPSATYQPEGTHGHSEGNGGKKGDETNVLWKDEDDDAFMSNEDYGYGTNCGPKKANVLFRWTPKVIDPQGSVKIEFKMVAPVSFSNGRGSLDLAVLGQDRNILSLSMDLSCAEDIKPRVHGLNCPLQKGLPIKFSYDETNLTRLPTGAFNITLKILNEVEKQFLCVQLPVELKPGD